MRLQLVVSVALLGLVALAAPAPVAAQAFKDLLAKMPAESNALVLLNAKKLRDSAFARDFRAKTLRGTTQSNQYVVPRDEMERLVLAAELNQQLNPQWEAAVVETNTSLSFAALEAAGHGQQDSLNNTPALHLANAYLMQLGPKLYGAFGPTNRQRAMRWVEHAKVSQASELSPYLSKIAEYPETVGTEVMLGLDLAGMVDLRVVRENLKQSATAKKYQNVDAEELAQVLASLQGIALGVKATETLNASLRVDFGKDPAIMKDFAKPLLLEKLGDLGLMIDEFERWEGSVRGNTFYLTGELSAGGLRKVLSLIDPPTVPAAKPVASKDIPSPSELDPMALPSQRYFHEVAGLLDEMGKRENLKYAKQFSWYDKYARKISQLSMVNVDPELLDYGLATSTALRSMAYNLRNQAAEASQYSNNRQTTWNAYGDWYNGYIVTYDTPPSEREKAEKLSKMYGTMSYADTVQNVGNMTAEMRRRMVERYKIDF